MVSDLIHLDAEAADHGPVGSMRNPQRDFTEQIELARAPADGHQPDGPLSTLRRRWLVVVAMILLAVGLAGAGMTVRHPAYTSTSSVFLSAVPGNALSTQAISNSQQLTVAMQTEASLVRSPGVMTLAAGLLGKSFTIVPGALSASVPQNTQIVRIQYVAATPLHAQEGARAFATAFLAYRKAQGQATTQRQLGSLQQQSTAAEQQLSRATKQSTSNNPPAGASIRVQLYTSRLAGINESIGQIDAQDLSPGSVVIPATAAVGGVLNNKLLLLALALLLGLGAGVALALLLERFDGRVRAGHQTRGGEVPIWARIPRARRGQSLLVDELDPADPVREGFRRARAGVLRATGGPCVLTVTRDEKVPGVLESTVNLALAIRDAGYSVALVDASLEEDAFGRGMPTVQYGLAEHLIGVKGRKLWLPHWRQLEVLPAGSGLGSVRDLLSGQRMAELVEELREVADYVVVAAPAASDAEAIALSGLADATVLVARDGVTTHRMVELHASRHQEYGGLVCGLVCVSPHRSRWWRRHGGRR